MYYVYIYIYHTIHRLQPCMPCGIHSVLHARLPPQSADLPSQPASSPSPKLDAKVLGLTRHFDCCCLRNAPQHTIHGGSINGEGKTIYINRYK